MTQLKCNMHLMHACVCCIVYTFVKPDFLCYMHFHSPVCIQNKYNRFRVSRMQKTKQNKTKTKQKNKNPKNTSKLKKGIQGKHELSMNKTIP